VPAAERALGGGKHMSRRAGGGRQAPGGARDPPARSHGSIRARVGPAGSRGGARAASAAPARVRARVLRGDHRRALGQATPRAGSTRHRRSGLPVAGGGDAVLRAGGTAAADGRGRRDSTVEHLRPAHHAPRARPAGTGGRGDRAAARIGAAPPSSQRALTTSTHSSGAAGSTPGLALSSAGATRYTPFLHKAQPCGSRSSGV